MIKSKFKFLILIVYYLPILILVKMRGQKEVYSLCNRWFEVLPIERQKSMLCNMLILFHKLTEFRSTLYYYLRIRSGFIKWLYPGMTNLYINSASIIGKGLVIQHGHSTRVGCEKMGNNCQIWQNVTIGKSKSGGRKPIIGSNVKICCNAVVVGNINIGDNVTIGAGAIVIKDVPSNCVVVGNPAKIVKKCGINCCEYL